MQAIIELLRIKQWAKNIFIFLPLFFGNQITNPDKLLSCIWAFLSFSLIASCIYCFNDIVDIAADKVHPKKCKRPIARGDVTVFTAYIVMAVLLVGGLSLTLLTNNFQAVIGIIGGYFVLNIAYTLKLKQIAIVDVLIISLGFVLRIVVGGQAAVIDLSQWIVLMTFLLALFLAFAKRRDDVVIYEQTGVTARQNAMNYNLAFINTDLSIISAVLIVCYIQYAVSDEVTMRLGSKYLYATSIFVIAGLLRYLQLTIVDNKSGSPTDVLYSDLFIKLSIVFWIASFILIIYL